MKSITKTLTLTIGLVAILLTSSGCTTTYYHQKYPVIPKPDRPVLSEELDVNDLKKMIKYAIRLEVAIEAYNTFAEEKNKKLEEEFKRQAEKR